MYKKITLATMLLLCYSLIASAQIKEGSFLLNGAISYINTNNYDFPFNPKGNYSSPSFTISAGKAFKENSVFGVILSYSNVAYSNIISNNIDYGGIISPPYRNNKTNSYNAGVFYKKYKKLAKDFYLFGQLEVAFDFSHGIASDSSNESITIKSIGAQIVFTPGISYQILKNLQLELTIPNVGGIDYSTSKNIQPSIKENSFSFNTSLNSFGITSFGVGCSLIF